MFRNNPMFRIIWWSFFTSLTDLSALRGLYIGQANGISIIAATIMTFGLIYLIASYKVDGPAGVKLEPEHKCNPGVHSYDWNAGAFVFFRLV